MASRYWVVSLPVQNSAASVWNRLQEQISKHSFDTPLYRFNIPNLRVGTLDSLLALSDDLVKSNSFVESVSHKIRRQIEELERVSGIESSSLSVDGVPVDTYLTRFVWDEAKYPTMSPLREIVDGIHTLVAKIEDDLKGLSATLATTYSNGWFYFQLLNDLLGYVVTFNAVRVAEYNNVRSQLNAINRKQSGSLAVRDLSNLVKPEDIITSEHLVTLLAVVPKYSQKDWLASYETLTSYVVPRSSKLLYEDNEYALYTVTLFGRVADNFRIAAREKGFQIRDFEYSSEAQESRNQELEKLVHDQESLRSSLLQWCYTSYGEACVLAPSVKGEKKVRSILEELCGNANSTFWKSEDDGGMMAAWIVLVSLMEEACGEDLAI
ncbi:V-type proton ATPase subunit C [Citrus sinensis]|nr:V-type proton ATPase subunit C [Citrus sinensis]